MVIPVTKNHHISSANVSEDTRIISTFGQMSMRADARIDLIFANHLRIACKKLNILIWEMISETSETQISRGGYFFTAILRNDHKTIMFEMLPTGVERST